MLALCSGALRRYLTRHGGLPRKPLMATMPISLRAPGNKDFTRRRRSASSIWRRISPILSSVSKRCRRLPARPRRWRNRPARSFRSTSRHRRPLDHRRDRGTLRAFAGRQTLIPPLANVVISNVAGPQVPLYAGGALMTDYWPLSIVEHGCGLNITLMSYNGVLCVGFTAARCAMPDAQEIVADTISALAQLKRAALPEPVVSKPHAPKVARAKTVRPKAARRKPRAAAQPKKPSVKAKRGKRLNG